MIYLKKIIILLLLLLLIKLISFSEPETNFNVEQKEVTIVDKNKVINKELEEYIIGVVAGEMPALYEEEALKAQAVASRTYAINKIRDNESLQITTDDQVYITIDQMKEKWQDNFNLYYEKIKKAVYDTKGQIIYYNHQPIKAFYYASSNGYTESCIDVFKEDIEYLKINPSIDKDNYNEITISKKEFCEKLNLNCEKIEITNIIKNESNRVSEITINNNKYTGIEIRKMLSLRSTDFEIQIQDEYINIKTNGYGHGVGMSQKGANLLAKENYKYNEIIEYYYPNTIIRNI